MVSETPDGTFVVLVLAAGIGLGLAIAYMSWQFSQPQAAPSRPISIVRDEAGRVVSVEGI